MSEPAEREPQEVPRERLRERPSRHLVAVQYIRAIAMLVAAIGPVLVTILSG